MSTFGLSSWILLSFAHGFIIMMLALGISLIARRQSAALRHRVWTLGFLACLFSPLVTTWVPQWRLLSPPPTSVPRADVVSRREVPLAGHVPDVTTRWSHRDVHSTLLTESSSDGMVRSQAASGSPDTVAIASEPSWLGRAAEWSVLSAVLWIWTIVSVVLLGRLVARGFITWRMVHRSCSRAEANWQRSLDEMAVLMAVRGPVKLRWNDRIASPMVAGLLRNTILLPSSVNGWSPGRRRMVLMHELAHIRRRDVMTRILANLVASVHWFNPLVWWGVREMRRLQEVACDDLVVLRTAQPSRYARALLDVAKQVRVKDASLAVAMARTCDVEERIHSILDRTRNRRAITGRASWISVLTAASCLVAIAGWNPVSQGQTPAETETAEDAAGEATDDQPRSLTVTVLDSAGKPLAEANVHVSVWEFDGKNQFPNQDFTTDAQGQAEILLPRRLRILRLWSSKPGYVPQFVNFAEGTHQDGRDIPDAFEFRHQPGTTLSGTVVDPDGNPVQGANVQVRVDVTGNWTADPQPIVNTWLATGDDAAITDQDGRWEIHNAPAEPDGSDFDFWLQVTHPEFAGDTRWGELQSQQGVTAAMLRLGTAKLTLRSGIVIQGDVTGPDGEPVKRGLVVWDDNPYFVTGVNETLIKKDGKYRTKHLAPGEYPITVMAPGFAPTQKQVKAGENESVDGAVSIDFQLQPGNPISLHIVDPDGNPIPKARVGIGEWRGMNAIYNHLHPNVPASGIPTRTDDEGSYRWDWAPEDEVEYSIYAEGFDSKRISLIARKEPHRVQLERVTNIHGRVIDRDTRQPIPTFRVIEVEQTSRDRLTTDFQSPLQGKQGAYTYPIQSHGQSDRRYYVRLEANGYRTAISEKSVGIGEPPLRQDFELERAPALTAMVLDPAGKPSKDFTVAVATPTVRTRFSLDRLNQAFGIMFRVEDSYQFDLPATFEPRRIRVFSADGFVEVMRQPDQDIGILRMEPWSSVSGTLQMDGKPLANHRVYARPIFLATQQDFRFPESFGVQTDSEGKFEFSRLPPVPMCVHVNAHSDSPLTASVSHPVVLRPGDHQSIDFGPPGVRLTGQVVISGLADVPAERVYVNGYLVKRGEPLSLPAGSPELDFDNANGFPLQDWSDPNFHQWLNTRTWYRAELTDDRNFGIPDVSPGTYDWVVQVGVRPEGGDYVVTGSKALLVTVEDRDIVTGTLKVDTVEVHCEQP